MFVVPWLLAVLAQAPAAGPVEVAGRVEDAKRQPVAGAEVWVSGLAPGVLRRNAEARATSDAQGRFRLTVPAPKNAQTTDLPWAVWATHAAHGLGGQTFTRQSLAKAKDKPLVVKLAAARGSDRARARAQWRDGYGGEGLPDDDPRQPDVRLGQPQHGDLRLSPPR